MKVLITGASGFIGRHLVPEALARNHEVSVIIRDVRAVQHLEWIDRVRVIVWNIHHPHGIGTDVLGRQDAAIHLAWAGLPNYKAAFHLEENLPAHRRFLMQLLLSGIGQLLVSGTCLEYGMKSGCLSEDMPSEPGNPYAQAKEDLRKYLEEVKREHPFILQWARLFYMYGPGQNSSSLIAQLDAAIERGDRSFRMSGGEQLRDYLPVQEVARRLVTLLEHPACEGTVNLCSGEPTSVRHLVERHLTLRQASIDLDLGHYPYPDYEPMAFWGAQEKYRRYCGHG